MRTLLTFAISAVGSSAPFLLPKRERQKGGGGAKKKKIFLAVYAGNTDLLGGGADSFQFRR